MHRRRKKSQPLADRTAGCVFRNPADAASAGYLIEKAGLKGATIGGARVSQVHANFVANFGGASCTSDDILRLIALVKERVKQTSGIELEEEIVYVPYD
jgi:UDP-N-acetylenolpyruvoylglucosamine reductase